MTLIMSRAIAALSTVRRPRSTACCCRRNRGDRSLTWARLAAFWEADGQLPPILGRNPKTLFTRARRLPGSSWPPLVRLGWHQPGQRPTCCAAHNEE
jgi:hypothetical protein